MATDVTGSPGELAVSCLLTIVACCWATLLLAHERHRANAPVITHIKPRPRIQIASLLRFSVVPTDGVTASAEFFERAICSNESGITLTAATCPLESTAAMKR